MRISLVALLLTVPWGAHASTGGTSPPAYAGWAAVAYPELTAQEMEAMVARMAAAGANVLWIGHNNPGEVEAGKVEPGLSYAVYRAYRDPGDPRHGAAAAIVAAQHRILQACRAAGMRAVLPVGYQIQMGRAWNDEHPQDLRLDAAGQPLDIYGGGVSASYLSPAYRQDIVAYYRWVDAEFVRPFEDVLLMLNLADEPIGGDYSAHAEAEFRARHGFGFSEVANDPERQRLLGAFQSGYVVEYAAYSALLWQGIHPGLRVTMSFDGAQARSTFSMPDVERLFRDTPDNLTITLDAYPHDGPPGERLADQDLVTLFLLARSAGLYSARYGRPVWLWAAANSWGLSGAGPDPGGPSDAVANGLYLALLVRQAGGSLEGIAYWNYNVRGQGLYDDAHRTTYEPDLMFERVSAALPHLRRIMQLPPGRPNVYVLAPPGVAHRQIGARREAVGGEVHPFSRLAVLARTGMVAAVVGALDGWPLEGIRAVVVLSPSEEYLAPGDLEALGAFLERGGRLVASSGVSRALGAPSAGTGSAAWGGLVRRTGNLYSAQEGVGILFEDSRGEALSGFWLELLGVSGFDPGFRIVTSDAAFYYQVGPEAAQVYLRFPFEGFGHRYGDQALPVERIHGPFRWVELGRRQYLLIWRAPPGEPWRG